MNGQLTVVCLFECLSWLCSIGWGDIYSVIDFYVEKNTVQNVS